MFNYYDTSALLSLNDFPADNVYISRFVFGELEHIKSSAAKDEDIKFKARKIVRHFMNLPAGSFTSWEIDQRKIDKIIAKHHDFNDNMDSRILAEAILLQEKGEDVVFWTSDSLFYLIAKNNLKEVHYLDPVENRNSELKVEYYGEKDYTPSFSEMNELYSNPKNNILGALPNQYCRIYENGQIKDILRWDGTQYNKLSYKSISSAVGQKWSPLNIEQKELFDLLQNPNIPVKLALGSYGSGMLRFAA